MELPEQATSRQIKANYRRLLRKWHPDRCREDKDVSQEKTRCLIQAYKIITEYCNNYKFSFSEEEVRKYLSQEEWWIERFGQDPRQKERPRG